MRYLRHQLNRLLQPSGCERQKQPYDHVLREKDRTRDAFPRVAWYIRANPLRSGLVADEEPISCYPFSGCVAPGYPELDIHADEYWDRSWRIYEHLCASAPPRRMADGAARVEIDLDKPAGGCLRQG